MKKTKLIILGTALLLLCSLTVLGIHAELTDAGKQLQKYDLDCDGKISIADVTALLNCLSGNCTHEKENGICSLEQGRSNDISKDDTVTITDVTVMLDYLARNCNHIEKPLEDVAPTCKQTGLTGGSYCSVCKKVLSTQGEVPTIGHNYVSGKCTMCGAEEYLSTLEVTSVSANKSFLSTGEQVTFSAATNKDSSALTLTATIYLNGSKISTLSGTGNLKYTPTSAGRYDAEISVTDDGITFFTYFLKSCFDVKDSWELTQITTNKSTVTLGEALVFSPKVSGASSDLSYTVTIYKNGAAYHTAETTGDFTFYPNVAGTYYAVFEAMDSFGEKQSAKSGNVVVKVQTAYNTLITPNAGTTLNVDDLNGKTGNDVIVPSGKNITLVWDKKSTDSYYRLRISTPDNDTDNFGVSKSNYTSNTYTISSADLVPGNKYRVSVERYDASKAKIESILMYFVVAGGNSILAEDPFAITSPVQAGVYAPNDVTVQWTKMNYASKYVLSLEYYCGAGYHTVLEDIEIDGSQNTYTISKSNLHRGCKHRLEIYVYDDLGNELSETLSFRIEGDPALYEVDKPEITNSHFSDSWSSIKTYPTYEDITITWTKIPAAPYYEILVEDDYGDALVLTNADCVKTNKFVIPVEKLTPGYEYSVRVLASCGDGHSKSSKKYFRAPYPNGATLEGPELTSHGFSKDKTAPTTVVEQSLTITWNPVSAAKTYSVLVYEVGQHDPYFNLTNITTCSATIPKRDITSGYDYEIRIFAKDENGSTAESSYYIRVVDSALEKPVVIDPTLATDEKGYLPSFEEDFTITWDAVDGAVSYDIRVYEYFDDSYFRLIDESLTNTAFDVSLDELYFGGIFRVVIWARDQYGGGNRSEEYFFQVGSSDYIGLKHETWAPLYGSDYMYTYVETVGDWTAKPSASWITIDQTDGTGTTRIKISVTENTASTSRSGKITFTNAEGGTAVFSITQAGASSSQTGSIQITSPEQNDVVENDALMVKWTLKYGDVYFSLDLFDKTENKETYHQGDITSLSHRIPAEYIESGHTYELTISVFNFSNVKGAETSIVFKVEGDIVESGNDDATDDGSTDGDSSTEGDTEEDTSSVSCNHTSCKKELVSTTYTNLIKSSTTHSGFRLYNKTCVDCGQALDNEKVFFSGNSHSINAKGYCDCGYTSTSGYQSWAATNESNARVVVYQTPESPSQHGYINAGEKVTVLAECCGRYLIQYTLDSGSGVKQGYVNMHSLSKEEPLYTIYINNEYFNDDFNLIVAEKNTYYQLYIKNNTTDEIVKYGTDGLSCKSNDASVAEVGATGTMSIRSTGMATVQLMQNGKVLDSIQVYGCLENSRVTNYAAVNGSELYNEGFAPNCRLKVFNYKSAFVSDDSYEGGGYYKVTFDVYNDVPTIFCVAAFDKNGEIVKQELIGGYSAEVTKEVISAFKHFGDIFNGKMISGESEAYATKTSVTLKVPLGGYVDFLTLSNSRYMIYANVLSGMVVSAMETADVWTEFVKVSSADIEFDKMKFAQEVLDLICEETHMSTDAVIDQIIEICMDAEGYTALATELMGYLGDKGVSMADLFEVLAKCSSSALPELRLSIVDGTIDLALGAVPPAKVIKKLTDAVVATMNYAIVIKDIASMANDGNDFLIILYPKYAPGTISF